VFTLMGNLPAVLSISKYAGNRANNMWHRLYSTEWQGSYWTVNLQGCERSSLNPIQFRITGNRTDFELGFSQIQAITAANLTANFDFLPQIIQSLTGYSQLTTLKKCFVPIISPFLYSMSVATCSWMWEL